MARPLKYTSVQEMQGDINRYFKTCFFNREVERRDRNKKPEDIIVPDDPDQMDFSFTHDLHPTISGLAVALDWSRRGIIDYEERDEFFHTIKDAKNRVEAYVEQKLYGGNPAGLIFNLKNNFMWKDKSEVENTGKSTVIINNQDAGNL